MAQVLNRIGNDLRIACSLLRAGATVRSTLLYPLRRRFFSARHQLELRNGVSIVSPSDEPILPMFERIWRGRVFSPPGCELGPGDTVVDVGANVGVFTIWAATRHSEVRVIAIEPSPRICRFLRRNVEASGLRNVTVVEAACASTNGEATLYAHGYETNNSLYPQDVYGSQYEPRYSVRTRSLEDIFREFGVSECSLLKMNCEGAEYDIILSVPPPVLAAVKAIAMEYHRGRVASHPDRLREALEKAGFAVELLPLHDPEGGYLYAKRNSRG